MCNGNVDTCGRLAPYLRELKTWVDESETLSGETTAERIESAKKLLKKMAKPEKFRWETIANAIKWVNTWLFALRAVCATLFLGL